MEHNYKISDKIIHHDKYDISCQIYNHFFKESIHYLYLMAPTQWGKTDIINYLTRIMRNNEALTNIKRENIFIFTGMSDNDWKKQTKERLHKDFHDNIFHSPTIKNMKKRIISSNNNCLLIWDESHTASSVDNTISKEIKYLRNGDLFRKNIYLLTLSASSPVEIKHVEILQKETPEGVYSVKDMVMVKKVPLSEDYTSIKTLFDNDRIRESEKISEDFILQLLTEMFTMNKTRYHIIRVHGRNYDNNKQLINDINKDNFDDYFDIIEWNSKTKNNRDINTILNKRPKIDTIIIVKEMFRSAKTLNDKYIGILVDRSNKTKTSTTMQSFLGRSCGYDRSSDTVIYTNMENAVKCLEIFENGWLETNSWEAPHSKMDRHKQLATTGKEIQSVISGDEKIIEKEKIKVFTKIFERKDYKCEIDFKHEIDEFYKNIKKNSHIPRWDILNNKDENGFMLSTVRGITRIFSLEEILYEKRAGLNQKCIKRINICYKSIKDKKSKCAVIKYIKV